MATDKEKSAALTNLRSRLREKREIKENAIKGFSGGGLNYPFFSMKEGQQVRLRFLPYENDDGLFWEEKVFINLPFPYIKGQPVDPTGRVVEVEVPTMSEWRDENDRKYHCEILAYSRQKFDEAKAAGADKNPPTPEGLEIRKQGSAYWKKVKGIFQGFVHNCPLKEENPPENPIRKFVLNKTLLAQVKTIETDTEILYMPTDYENGLDFIVKKTQKGSWASYDTSTWAREPTDLTDEEKAAVEKHGLLNLKDFLLKKPTEEEQKIIIEMFHASVAGEPYDPEKWARYYKPYGLPNQYQSGGGQPTGATAKPAAAEKPVTETKPAETTADTAATAQTAETTTEATAEAATAETKPETPTPAAATTAADTKPDVPTPTPTTEDSAVPAEDDDLPSPPPTEKSASGVPEELMDKIKNLSKTTATG